MRTCQDEVSTLSVRTAVTKKTKHKAEEETLNWRLSWCYKTKDKRMAETLKFNKLQDRLTHVQPHMSSIAVHVKSFSMYLESTYWVLSSPISNVWITTSRSSELTPRKRSYCHICL